jgi:hypothetical protein
MEGVAAEAASHAGQLGLGRLIYLYDDNDISLDGPTSLSFSVEDRGKRFEAYGWQVLSVDDANDVAAIEAAIEEGKAETERPTLIRVKSIIGYPSPNKQGSQKAHGARLGEDEVRATKEVMGWDPDAHFLVPDGVYDHFRQGAERGREEHAAWNERFEAFRQADADRATEWDAPGRTPAARCPASPTRCAPSSGPRTSSPRARRQGGHGRHVAVRADDGRRRGRPVRVDQDGVPRRPRGALRARQAGPQRLLGRARARHGRRGERACPRTAGSSAPTARPSCSSRTTCAAPSASAR